MEKNFDEIIETEPERYTPRPAWQIWAAWIGIAIMIVCIILYYWHIASGGLL